MKRMMGLLLVLALVAGCLPAMAQIEVQTFPEAPANFSQVVNPANPLETIFTGAYRVPLTVGEEERSVVVYLAEGFAQTQGFVMIVPAPGMTAEQALEEGGWKAVADRYQLYLMVLEPDGETYDLSYEGRDFAYITQATALADTRNYWRQPEGRNYMVGYGGGAALALMSAQATLPNVWAGVATFGDMELAAEDIRNANGTELPVWMFVSQLDAEAALVDLFKGYNGCTDQVFSNQEADMIYFPNQQVNHMLLNDQPMSQVRVTVAEDAAALNGERALAVYDFLRLGTREVGYGDKAMRYTHELEDWGAQVKTVEMDGVTRSWIEYVPTTLRYTSEQGAPLMVALHGGALNGEYFAERTSFIKLAEDKGFIIVFPTGYIGQGITPGWNWLRDESGWDDVGFIQAMLADVQGRLPVDASRIYCYGHSMGGMFTQVLVSYLDGVFAAAGGTGCVTANVPQVEHQYQTPISVFYGANESRDPVLATGENPQAYVNYFTAYNDCGTLADVDGAYLDGRFHVYVWENEDGAPMVQYIMVDDLPHTATLDIGVALYDWMSQFNRNADGSVGYRTGIYAGQ